MGIYKKYDKWCEFFAMCKYFRENSFGCTHNEGDPHCGKYREFKKRTIVIEDIEKEMNEISLQCCNAKTEGEQEILRKKINSLQDLKTMLQKEKTYKNLIKRTKPHLEVS